MNFEFSDEQKYYDKRREISSIKKLCLTWLNGMRKVALTQPFGRSLPTLG